MTPPYPDLVLGQQVAPDMYHMQGAQVSIRFIPSPAENASRNLPAKHDCFVINQKFYVITGVDAKHLSRFYAQNDSFHPVHSTDNASRFTS